MAFEKLGYKLQEIQGKFNINLNILKRYNNTYTVIITKAKYEHRELKTDDGVQDRRYLVVKYGGGYSKIPLAQQIAREFIEGKESIWFMQYDANTFYPIFFDKGVIKARVAVDLYQFKDGKPICDEQGNPIPLLDANGRKRYEYQDKVILDSNVGLSEGRFINMPVGVVNKSYDKEQWLGTEIVDANVTYRTTDWWSKYGTYVIFGLFLVISIVMISMTASFYNDFTTKNVAAQQEVANALIKVSDRLAPIVERYAPTIVKTAAGNAPPA